VGENAGGSIDNPRVQNYDMSTGVALLKYDCGKISCHMGTEEAAKWPKKPVNSADAVMIPRPWWNTI